MKQCPYCSAELPDEARACSNCGRPLPDMIHTEEDQQKPDDAGKDTDSADTASVDYTERIKETEEVHQSGQDMYQQNPQNAQGVQNWDQSAQDWNQNPQDNQSAQGWNSNQQNWDQSAQGWNSNQQNWNQNPQNWNQNPQDWNQNPQNWDQNAQGWNRNPQGWNQDPQGWDQNPQNWNNNSQGWNRNPQGWNQNQQQNWYGQQSTSQQRSNPFAMTSLICGMAATVLNSLLFVPSILAIIFGIIGYVQTKKNPDKFHGGWMAVVGMVMGVICLIVYGVLFARVYHAILQNPEFIQQIQQYVESTMGLHL